MLSLSRTLRTTRAIPLRRPPAHPFIRRCPARTPKLSHLPRQNFSSTSSRKDIPKDVTKQPPSKKKLTLRFKIKVSLCLAGIASVGGAAGAIAVMLGAYAVWECQIAPNIRERFIKLGLPIFEEMGYYVFCSKLHGEWEGER